MPNTGYIYILVNPSLEGLVKIGKTTRDPAGRAKELSAATGVPTPFVVVYEAFVKDCDEAEQYVHALLEQMSYRVAENREFFRVPVPEAVRAMIQAESIYGVEVSISSDESNIELQEERLEPWEEIMNKAWDYLQGLNGEFQDVNESLKCYIQAKKLGNVHANFFIGMILNDTDNTGLYDRGRALEYFKQGATGGDISCYIQMASIFAKDNHRENWLKCWDAVFESDAYFVDGIDGHSYLCQANEHNWPIKYLNLLYGIRDEILTFISERIRIAKEEYSRGPKYGDDELLNRKVLEYWYKEHRKISKILS